MKNEKGLLLPLLRLAVFAASALAFGAHAQEDAGAEDAEDAAPPQMQRLFYSVDERMELEILRQNRLAAELRESTKVFEVVLHEEPFDDAEEVVLQRDPQTPVEIHAVVRRHSDGKTFLWIGNESYDLQKDSEFLDKTNHILLDPMQTSLDDGVFGIDRISEKRFRLRVGQSIDAAGRLRDNYPAIVVRNRKQ